MREKKKHTGEKIKEENGEEVIGSGKIGEGRENSLDSKKSLEKEIETQNLQLKRVLIFLGAATLVFLLSFYIIYSTKNFEYQGVKWNVIKEKNLVFYRTFFPFYDKITGNHIADYNIYIRNDPRELKDVPFTGTVNLQENIVINLTNDDISCNGDGGISMANMVNTYQALGMSVMQDPKAQCDSQGRYTFINIKNGNSTEITQFGPSCYTISINNCEVLKGTERFLMESIVKLNEKNYVLEK